MSVHTNVYDATQRSLHERFFHAITFEVIAIIISTPIFAFIMSTSISDMGVLSIMISLIAMLTNCLYNYVFDLAQRRMGFERTLKIRLLHAVLFEVSLIVVLVPIAAWWLDLSLLKAFMLDFCFTLFFLPYSFIYNYTYDHIRKALFMKKMEASIC